MGWRRVPPGSVYPKVGSLNTDSLDVESKTLVSFQVDDTEKAMAKPSSVTFSDDLSFMKKHTPIVLLKNGDAAVAIAPAYQGRVMTSTFDTGRTHLYLRRRGTVLARP